MTPKPWSHSALDDFKNCPRAFFEKKVAKSVVETKGEATMWGEQVHKHFEEFLEDGVALPTILEMHEPFLQRLLDLPGQLYVEQKIALDRSVQPCEFFGEGVWYRGVIDAKKVHGDSALIVDHKSGKHHSKFGQLKLFALHTFAAHPEVNNVRCEYYWTQLKSKNGESYSRDDIPRLWKEFIPDLKQYVEAFKTDTWQPRPSGLCNGWCPVETCEFWKQKRKRN